jgi:branched-chain amino acid aminotransferase
MVTIRALKQIWMNGRFEAWDDARIHVLSHGLHYGYSVFEGIRCHATPRGPAIFRLDDHLTRFANSARIYRMKLPYTTPELREACVDLVRRNGIADAYLRPIAFSGYGEMGLDPSKCRIDVAIGLWEWGSLLGKAGETNGVRATVSSWARIDSRSLPPQAKCAANYANGALAKMEAAAGGYEEAILLNAAGMVAEGTGENIFRVKSGVVSTPPASSGILRGVTRDTVVRLVQEEGLTFQRTDFSREELFTADELFFTGTAAGIAPIREVDGRQIGDGQYPVVARLRARYDELVRGRASAHQDWLTYVSPTPAAAPTLRHIPPATTGGPRARAATGLP